MEVGLVMVSNNDDNNQNHYSIHPTNHQTKEQPPLAPNALLEPCVSLGALRLGGCTMKLLMS